MFAERARITLPRDAFLLHSSYSPCMDLVALLCKDNAPPLPAVGPPGLSAAQLAMRQRMLAFQARRMGVANPVGGSTQAGGEPTRGPTVKLVLWRVGAKSSPVWEVPVTPPSDLFAERSVPGSSVSESVCVGSLCWSPEGERLALSVLVTRASSEASATASVLFVYSVYDGALLETHRLSEMGADAQEASSMQWAPLHVDSRVPSQALQMLSCLAPLPALTDPVRTNAPQNSMTAHLAPGGLAARNQQADARPSAKTAKGQCVLAHVPALPISATEQGWVRPAAGDNVRTTPRAPDTDGTDGGLASKGMLLVLDRAGHLFPFLDGAVSLGRISLGDMFPEPVQGVMVTSSPEGTNVLSMLTVGGQAALARVALPLASPGTSPALRRSPLHLLPAVQQLAQLSTALRCHLAHALDAAYYSARAWNALARPRAVEWQRHLHDVSKRYATEADLELMVALMAGQTAPASEQLLMHNITEMNLIAMERDAKHGLKLVRRFAATSVLPTCERVLLLLQELRGCAAWPERFGGLLPASAPEQLGALERDVQTTMAVALALQEHAEMELLALDEFYKWWRMEQERQEKLKLEDDAPRVRTCHDTLTVLEFLQRGFISPALNALLGVDAPASNARRTSGADESSDEDESENAPMAAPELSVAYDPPRQDKMPSRSCADAVQATLSWMHTQEAHAEFAQRPPSEEQFAGVYGTPQLFAGAAKDYRGRATLPGDERTLSKRLEDITQAVAGLLTDALRRTSTHGHIYADAVLGPTDTMVTGREPVCSLPDNAPESMRAPGPSLLVQRRSSPSGNTLVCVDGGGGSEPAVLCIVRTAGEERLAARVQLPDVRGAAPRVLDMAFLSEEELLVLAGADDSRAAMVVLTLRDVAMTPVDAAPWRADGAPVQQGASAEVQELAAAAEASARWLATSRKQNSAVLLASDAHTLSLMTW